VFNLILDMNKYTLRLLKIYDFRALTSVVNIGLNTFKNLEGIEMTGFEVETAEEN